MTLNGPSTKFQLLAPSKGRALVDRELYLPKSWTDDRDRCADAGIAQDVEFATNPGWRARCWSG